VKQPEQSATVPALAPEPAPELAPPPAPAPAPARSFVMFDGRKTYTIREVAESESSSVQQSSSEQSFSERQMRSLIEQRRKQRYVQHIKRREKLLMQLPEEERVNELLATPPDESLESQESVREIQRNPMQGLGRIQLKARSQKQRNLE